jgi:hypothetical protein
LVWVPAASRKLAVVSQRVQVDAAQTGPLSEELEPP